MSKYYRLVKPLDFDKFSTVQNNFYLRFLEKPLNYYRYEIPDEAFDRYDQEEVKYELIPLMRILQKEDYDLERRLTTSLTKGDKEHCRAEAIAESMQDLYQAYLILRKYVEENEGKEFGFSIVYPPQEPIENTLIEISLYQKQKAF